MKKRYKSIKKSLNSPRCNVSQAAGFISYLFQVILQHSSCWLLNKQLLLWIYSMFITLLHCSHFMVNLFPFNTNQQFDGSKPSNVDTNECSSSYAY
ncbi:Uncharacterized protein TCM_002913 [Theobroma cacao]|uniref:Uncharacterized protein n=1 Tax=Theobroma cacao TaxID=3641 RepID=A0A061DMH5_THECC|nr:Uncharacterized protein TCM_002913 [Theobroma cacao]